MSSNVASSIPRPEHPRPDFMRDTFYNLNGVWQFAFDDENAGLRERWQRPGRDLGGRITVPFAYQTALSGIGPTDEIHTLLWYRRAFRLPPEFAGRRVLLRFGAVDDSCRVYVNGELVGEHRGGYAPFCFDITQSLVEGDNDLCLRVEDVPDRSRPRGKQYWDRGVMGCWYTPVSGIWQTVYLEAVGSHAVTRAHVIPDVEGNAITARVDIDRVPEPGLALRLVASFAGERCGEALVPMTGRRAGVRLALRGPARLWSPEAPNLYDLEVSLIRGDGVVDRVRTYFGLRKVEVAGGEVLLNGAPLYQRLVLDQGYWPDSLLTPPSDDALRLDVERTLAFGFNGARKHQKVEDPRYYYWADRLGLLVWGEVPSAYDFDGDALRGLSDALLDFIDRDFNHPSVICWVPLNESWGVQDIMNAPRQQAAARMLYQLTKAADGTRLCSSNDGWEQVETDICALHDYAADGATMAEHFITRRKVEDMGCDEKRCYVPGARHTGDEAFLVTEYGGIAFSGIGAQGEVGGMATWGYHDKVDSEEAFFARYQSVTDAIRALPYCRGYCYTQLTDVMQEINGLMTPDRVAKVDVERFREINGGAGIRD